MREVMTKQLVIIIGPPGSGKDTQALRLVQEFGMLLVPSSQILRAQFEARPADPIIQREKELFDTGRLNTPELVAQWIMDFVRPLAAQGQSLVFAGSPRVPLEAELEFPELLSLYGERNIRVIHLDLPEAEARRRIAGRRFCVANKHPIPGTPEFAHLTTCPQDGSALERRDLDDADLLVTRFQEYHRLTEPCLAIAERCGVAVFTVDGSKAIEAIHHDIVNYIERQRFPTPEN